ncbi:MAG: hypothetical protein AAF658_11270, partial [Myxococcota bacterium]
LANGNDASYCENWIGCAGSFFVANTQVTGAATECEPAVGATDPCAEDPCTNGICSAAADGAAECLCFGGFDGETCETAIDLCPGDANKTVPGTCGCGVSDVDGDEDGTPDCFDGCDDDAGKTAPGTCGCGVSDVDSDEDGTPDCDDECPADPNKVLEGECGCGQAEQSGGCEVTCPCFDNADLDEVALGSNVSCEVNNPSEEGVRSSFSSIYLEIETQFVAESVDFGEQGRTCSLTCGQEGFGGCDANGPQLIDEDQHAACVSLIAARCP